jgi:hypothetical protein
VVGTVGNCTTSVTFAGTALVHAKQAFHGTNTVQVSYNSCTSDIEAGAISFSGVNQRTPVAVTSQAGDMVVDVVGNGSRLVFQQDADIRRPGRE